MTIKLELQPEGSRQCGQAVVAMLAHKTTAEICRKFAHYDETTVAQVCRWLHVERIGYLAPRTGSNWHEHQKAILRINSPAMRFNHWILKFGGQIYCPSHGIDPDYLASDGLRINLYIPIQQSIKI